MIDKSGKEAFAAQCIPIDPKLLRLDRYKDFPSERRKLIAKRLNDFLQTM
jgi:hypothetical protein